MYARYLVMLEQEKLRKTIKAVLWHQEMEVNTQTVYKKYYIQR